MFGNNSKDKKTNEETKKSIETPLSIVANGTTIIGDVMSEGDIRVEGKILGKLVCKSRLVIGNLGKIEGNIDSANANIAGEVKGTIIVREVLQLSETARIIGDIITEKIVISQGAVFTGSCKMGQEAREKLKSTPIPNLVPAHFKTEPTAPKEQFTENGSGPGKVFIKN